jgi:hypothetical protein
VKRLSGRAGNGIASSYPSIDRSYIRRRNARDMVWQSTSRANVGEIQFDSDCRLEETATCRRDQCWRMCDYQTHTFPVAQQREAEHSAAGASASGRPDL